MPYYFVPNPARQVDTSLDSQRQPFPPSQSRPYSSSSTLEIRLAPSHYAPNPTKPIYELLGDQQNILNSGKSAQELIRLTQLLIQHQEQETHSKELTTLTRQSASPYETKTSEFPDALAIVLETILPEIRIASIDDIPKYANTLNRKERETLLPCNIYASPRPGENHSQNRIPIAEVWTPTEYQLALREANKCEPFYILLKRNV